MKQRENDCLVGMPVGPGAPGNEKAMLRVAVVARSRQAKTGMTLIEVVAALALAGSLLTVTIVGSTRHLRQMKAAERKSQATKRLDRFLSAWSFANFRLANAANAAEQAGLEMTNSELSDFPDKTNNGQQKQERFVVSLHRAGHVDLGDALKVRVEVSCVSNSRMCDNVAWAEVLVADEQ